MLYRRTDHLVTMVLLHLINMNDNTLYVLLKALYLGNGITWDFQLNFIKIINCIRLEPSLRKQKENGDKFILFFRNIITSEPFCLFVLETRNTPSFLFFHAGSNRQQY